MALSQPLSAEIRLDEDSSSVSLFKSLSPGVLHARLALRTWIDCFAATSRGQKNLRDGRIEIDAGGLAIIIVLLGMIYGLCMGSYSLLKEVPESLAPSDPNMRYEQLLATTLKVPALFYLTLLVTFPSLYVFNALVGSRLTLLNVLKLLVASLAVNLAVLASLGPIVLFFSLTTKSYPFIQLLNVAMFTVAGVLGLLFLRQTLHRLTTRDRQFVPAAKAKPRRANRQAAPRSTKPAGSRHAEPTRYAGGPSARPAYAIGVRLLDGCVSRWSVPKWAGCCGRSLAVRT